MAGRSGQPRKPGSLDDWNPVKLPERTLYIMGNSCAWCSPSDNGTDGICDDCMVQYFGINPVSIHAEIAVEQAKPEVSTEKLETVNAN